MKRVTRSHSRRPLTVRRSTREKNVTPVKASFSVVEKLGNTTRTDYTNKSPKKDKAAKSKRLRDKLQSQHKLKIDKSESPEADNDYRIIVIGAGIAGLACARELRERGYDVLVLEARTRPGGRLKTIPMQLSDSLKSKCRSRTQKKPNTKLNHPLSQHYDVASTISSLYNDDEPALVCPIDAGGAFIHGIDKNPIYEVCNKIGISTSRPMKGEDCLLMDYHNSAWPVNAEIDYKVQKRFNYVLDQAFKLSKAIMNKSTNSRGDNGVDENSDKGVNEIDLSIPKGADNQTSFGEIFEYVATVNTLENESIAAKKLKSGGSSCNCRNGGYPTNSIEASLFSWHVMNLEMSCGTTFEKLGLTWNEDECWGFGGEHVLLREGFGSLIECLKEGLDIQYGTEVTGIRIVEEMDVSKPAVMKTEEGDTMLPSLIRRSKRSNKGVCRMNIGHLSADQKDLGTYDLTDGLVSAHLSLKNKKLPIAKKTARHIQIQTKSSVLEADGVVCTLPLGCLSIPRGQSGHITFVPPLPERKKEAIERIGFGNYNKCVLTFPEVFWSSAADFVGVVGSPVAGSDVLFCNVSLVQDGLPIIIMIYGGKNAQEVEKLTDFQVVNECLDVLQRVCGKNNILLPIDYCVTRWGMDKFARGSFTYCPVGVDGEEELQVMSQPIYAPTKKVSHPLIMFAGESTTPYHPSTIHGAYISGIREAYRLDFSLYPKENNNLEFKDTFLYQRTFKLRKILKATKKRKIDSIIEADIRRSRRKKEVFNASTSIDDTGNIGMESSNLLPFHGEINPNHFTKSEDIALLRGVDTFGSDHKAMQLISNLMFPVPHTSEDVVVKRKRSAAALKQRYETLVSEEADRKNGSSDIKTQWMAPKESVMWWKARNDESKPTLDRSKKNRSLIPFRQSSRKRKPKKPTLYEDL